MPAIDGIRLIELDALEFCLNGCAMLLQILVFAPGARSREQNASADQKEHSAHSAKNDRAAPKREEAIDPRALRLRRSVSHHHCFSAGITRRAASRRRSKLDFF